MEYGHFKEENFSKRHIGLNEVDKRKLLKKLGYGTMDKFINDVVPQNIKRSAPMKIEKELSEKQLLSKINEYASLNKTMISMIGQGFYSTHTPSVLLRNILENPSWYTAYTPYQPEISQGRLEALLNFQTMISEITSLPIANASMLDESTAAAEAMTMSFKLTNNKNTVILDKYLHPQTINVIKTRAEPLGINLIISENPEKEKLDDCSCVIFQYPNTEGRIKNLDDDIKIIQSAGGMVILVADLLSLALIKSPGEIGADIAVGSTQRFGVPMAFGGPHAGYFATKEKFSRKMPGRLVGVSQDKTGLKAYRLALQTREQHIRREKATSNICTAQALLAIMAGFYGVWHGPNGLKNIAMKVNQYASKFANLALEAGFDIRHEDFFDTVVVETKDKTDEYVKRALNENINIRKLENAVSLSFDELSNDEVIDKLKIAFNINDKIKVKNNFHINPSLHRKEGFLEHPIFSSISSETEMLRYIRHLSDRDLALDRTMIPLGSCTMKLNASTEMMPITWPEFSNIHPFAPKDQTLGYKKLIDELEISLCTLTGYDGISLQPNAGSQGEFAGLLAIRKFHQSNGENNRNICLIPSSAHGTNPASAIMAGLKVVVIKTDERGNIDIDDLKLKIEEHKDNLAALMITYPSTHGVFESEIQLINELIHQNGGQVYMDGANMNAQVGLTSPKLIGADVCHLNLHKTFSIPHGGGGPGVGPICVAEHLKDFLPSNPIISSGGKYHIDAISSAPWGSALVCLISYGYIRMLGKVGIKNSTEMAIVNANYMKTKLEKNFKILYSGENGRSAHEFIIDCREFKKYNIEVVDIAKRLIDYGFHAPTVSFPVPGTMMIEPTESENLSEIDRFCDALNSIFFEITSKNEYDREMLKNSPHTLKMLTSSEWNYEYSRERASFPKDYLKSNKFWPSVRRVDEAYGDRNLICSCPPIETYQ